MTKVLQLYRFLNLLSLDVVAGAIICAAFFARLFTVAIRSQGLVALGLTVWIIYTADHLLDARKLKREASTERHRFHQKNFAMLASLVVIAAVIDASQLAFIRRPVLLSGMLLTMIIVVYFVGQRYLKYLKEFFAAILYSGGVLLLPLSLREQPLTTVYALMVLQFFVIALINLLLFSLFDHRQDERDARQSFATFFGAEVTKKLLVILFVMNVAFFIALLMLGGKVLLFPTLLLAAMNALLFVIMVRRTYFSIHDRYRLLGDAVFMIPLAYLFTTWV